MNDFASAAMFRVVRAGLRLQGLADDGPPPEPQAHVALADKRTWLDRLWQAHGAEAIVRLGEGVHGMDEEPLLLALSPARDPADLLQRWQRLERFVHSRHRMRVGQPEPGLLHIQHVSLDPERPPKPAEDLLVFGLLVALCERLDMPGVQARPAGVAAWSRQQRAWMAPVWPSDVSTWTLRWQPRPTSAVAKALHTDTDQWIAPLRAQLANDPGRGWTVDLLAQEAAASARTLQRQLARRGLSFTQLLSAARLSGAARLLTAGTLSTAEVGYVCGFADQAHFTRQFKRHTAMTPALYRSEFVERAGR